MKNATRMTKSEVRKEIIDLRKKINTYFDMTAGELNIEYDRCFPANKQVTLSTDDRRRTLIMQATYYLTNVFNIE